MGLKKIVHKIYSHIPYKRELYYALPFKRRFFDLLKKLGIIPPQKVYSLFRFTESFNLKIDEKHSFHILNSNMITNLIYWKGIFNCWEKTSITLWIKLLQKSEVIFDIGAHTGIYSLVSKSIKPQAQVYAFEPHPSIFRDLKKNVEKNKYDIHLIQKAISNTNGKIKIINFSPDSNYTNNEIEVPSITLDYFVESNTLNKVDLVKIDVETFEPSVIEGFKNAIQKYRPTLLIEILNEEVAQSLNTLFEDWDYLYFNINDVKGTIRQTPQLEKSDYFNYLICERHTAQNLGLL